MILFDNIALLCLQLEDDAEDEDLSQLKTMIHICDIIRKTSVGTPVVSELYKHVIYISHANEESYWGTNPGRVPRQVVQRTTPLNARLGA